jgi:non-canonical (house-cleaning) NTP pyrophosphatase
MFGVGINGGFDNDEPEYEETHSIVILPEYVSLSFPSVELPEKVLNCLLLVLSVYITLLLIKEMLSYKRVKFL